MDHRTARIFLDLRSLRTTYQHLVYAISLIRIHTDSHRLAIRDLLEFVKDVGADRPDSIEDEIRALNPSSLKAFLIGMRANLSEFPLIRDRARSLLFAIPDTIPETATEQNSSLENDVRNLLRAAPPPSPSDLPTKGLHAGRRQARNTWRQARDQASSNLNTAAKRKTPSSPDHGTALEAQSARNAALASYTDSVSALSSTPHVDKKQRLDTKQSGLEGEARREASQRDVRRRARGMNRFADRVEEGLSLAQAPNDNADRASQHEQAPRGNGLKRTDPGPNQVKNDSKKENLRPPTVQATDLSGRPLPPAAKGPNASPATSSRPEPPKEPILYSIRHTECKCGKEYWVEFSQCSSSWGFDLVTQAMKAKLIDPKKPIKVKLVTEEE